MRKRKRRITVYGSVTRYGPRASQPAQGVKFRASHTELHSGLPLVRRFGGGGGEEEKREAGAELCRKYVQDTLVYWPPCARAYRKYPREYAQSHIVVVLVVCRLWNCWCVNANAPRRFRYAVCRQDCAHASWKTPGGTKAQAMKSRHWRIYFLLRNKRTRPLARRGGSYEFLNRSREWKKNSTFFVKFQPTCADCGP